MQSEENTLENGLRVTKGFIDGKPVSVLRDTGATTIFVSDSVVSGDISEKKREVTLANGDVHMCPEVKVHVESPYITGTVDALVLNNPFADVVVGNIGNVYFTLENCESVQITTRSMKKKEELENQTEVKNYQKWKADDYKDEEVINSKVSEEGFSDISSRGELIAVQKSDKTLDRIRMLSNEGKPSRNAQFLLRDGILYRAFHCSTNKIVHQIVVRLCYRDKLLSLAHDTLCGGHMGNRKTRNRILQIFYWPIIFKDVAKFCRSCPQCQKSKAKGRPVRATLISVPPMAEPFTRVAIDIVGPLHKTKSGNRYILTLCDYSTKYPEAIPLRTIDTETVANALIEIFSRTGIPKEIISDQCSNFTSSLMRQLCKLLHIKKQTSTPYHPEADGLVKKFNGTLKKMLSCFVESEKDEWDKYLPYLLFSYREVPIDTTGFSPFEIMYGRHVRGPLTVIREELEEPKTGELKESVVSYLLKTRGILMKMSDLALQSELKSKRKQKAYSLSGNKLRVSYHLCTRHR